MANFDIENDEIRVIHSIETSQGSHDKKSGVSATSTKRKWWKWVTASLLGLILAIALLLLLLQTRSDTKSAVSAQTDNVLTHPQPYTEIYDTIVNGIPLKVFLPHNAKPHLALAPVSIEDSAMILGAQAADYGWDRNKWIIAGGFILKGELLSYSKSKYGFCALLDSGVVIGKALSTPYFERCIEEGGDFFRQYPLVYENEPQVYKSKEQHPRRALCQKDNRTFIVESLTAETLTAFAQALADISIKNAIALVSTGMAWRWATDQNGKRYLTGLTEKEPPPMASFIVWTKD